MKRNYLAAIALAVSTLTFVVPIGGAAAAPDFPAWCDPAVELRAEELPARLPSIPGCDLVGRVIRKGGVGVEVPPPGTTLAMSSLDPTGGTFSVASYRDGTVGLGGSDAQNFDRIEIIGVGDALGLGREYPDPCDPVETTWAWAHSGWKAYSPVTWYYNPANAPQSNVGGEALSSLNAAGWAVANGHNDCGITKMPRTSFHNYAGTTTKAAQHNGVECTVADNQSTIAWQTIASGSRGTACVSLDHDVTPSRLVTFDMVLNPNPATPWTTGTWGCKVGPVIFTDRSVDFQSSATFMWGQVFGLSAFVPTDDAQETQTMANVFKECNERKRTLGRGDLNGMLALYGSI